jgi:hypothetical protein
MTGLHLAQIATALVVAGTPWCVVAIAARVASWHARSVHMPFGLPRSVTRLGLTTAGMLPLVAAPAVLLSPRSLVMAGIDIVVFIGLSILGLRALSEIVAASRSAREEDATSRAAPLSPRRPGEYLSWPWRVLPFATAAAGLTLFVWRIALARLDTNSWLPIACACFAIVFLWLYEAWMKDEVSGGHTADLSEDDARHRRMLRIVLSIELALIAGFMGIAHGLLGLNWSVNAAWGAVLALAGAILGVLGCGFALSSELTRRRYRAFPLASTE